MPDERSRWSSSRTRPATSRSLLFVGVLTLLLFLGGCATSGRGEFPTFTLENPRERSLAVLPPVGLQAEDLKGSIMAHLQVPRLSERFQSVSVISDREVAELLGDNFSGERLDPEEARRIRERVDADLVLGFYVHEFAIREFSTTETKTLYRTESNQGSANVSRSTSDDDGSSNTHLRSQSSEFSTRQIPVRKGNIRVVLSLSAMIYDVEREEVVWRGRRIERAEDEMEDLSTIELKDIVVERVMYRIVSRLAS